MTKKAWVLLLTLGVIWGIPYLLIQIAVRDYDPVVVAFGRSVIGMAILLPFAVRRGALRSGFRHPGWVIAYTLCEISVPWVLIGFAETHVASSIAGLMIALTPILAVLFGAIASRQRIAPSRALGLVAGLAGVAALLGLDTAPPNWLAIGALALSSVGYAIGPIIVARKLGDNDTLGVVWASLLVASAIYVPALPSAWPSAFPLDASLAIIGLAAFCTALAFILLFELIREAGAERATVVAYINPAVAVLLGVGLAGERLTIGMLVGFLLIAAGTYLSTRSPAPEPAL